MTDEHREQARAFCKAVRQATTVRALADVVGLDRNEVHRHTKPVRSGRRAVGRQALGRMWRDWRSGAGICVYRDTQTVMREGWTRPQVAHLLDEVGTKRFALVCAEIGRTRHAARIMLGHLRRRMRILQPLEYTVRRLANLLHRPPAWVTKLVNDRVLRSYTDKRGKMVHRQDARWLLDWWDGKSVIPKHPGKCHEQS